MSFKIEIKIEIAETQVCLDAVMGMKPQSVSL
jgi:hypothetical protein